MRLNFFTLISLVLIAPCLAQKGVALDTLEIYKNKSGISWNKYKKHWFGGGYGFVHEKLNKQDSSVFLREKPCYVKVYDSNDRLWFESATDNSGMVTGDVVFYRTNGIMQRIEHYDDEMFLDSCPDSLTTSWEEPERFGVWKYYRRDGSLKKEKKFGLKGTECSTYSFDRYCRTTHFKRNGVVRREHSRIVRLWYW